MARASNFKLLAPSPVQNMWPTSYPFADEETYFVATNPTTGTGIATTTSVVDDATTNSATHAQVRPVMIIQNGYSANAVGPNGGPAPNIYPVSLSLLVTAAPTSATIWQCSMRLDPNQRYVSGGSTIAPVNPNSASGANSRALIYFGAITANAPSANTRLVANQILNPTIPVVQDTIDIVWGQPTASVSYINATTVNTTKVVNVPPVVIAPGYSLVIGMWGASNAGAPAFEFQFEYIER